MAILGCLLISMIFLIVPVFLLCVDEIAQNKKQTVKEKEPVEVDIEWILRTDENWANNGGKPQCDP